MAPKLTAETSLLNEKAVVFLARIYSHLIYAEHLTPRSVFVEASPVCIPRVAITMLGLSFATALLALVPAAVANPSFKTVQSAVVNLDLQNRTDVPVPGGLKSGKS